MKDLDFIKEETGITEDFINAKKMDKENRIFKSDSYVAKIYYPKKHMYYDNELKVYNSLLDKDYLSKLYFNGEINNFKYIVMERLNGISLFDTWRNLTLSERENSIKQIALILKDINNIVTQKKDFKQEFIINFNKNLQLLKDEYLKKYFKEIFDELIKYLNDIEQCYLIHIDTHFYNFFYNDKKIYGYDFENLTMAPLDYNLIRWYRMWQHPDDFYYPKNSLSAKDIDSYGGIMEILLDNYEEITKIDNLDLRVKLYELYYLMLETNRCNFDKDIVKRYVNNARKVKIY